MSVTVSTAQDPPPTVAILNPANGTQVERHQAISVLVRAQDTIGGVTKIYLEVTGQTIYSDIKQVSPALDVTREFNFAVSGTAQVGGLITITARAEDTSGKMSDPVSINLEVVDKTAPLVVITQPANNTPFNYGDTVNITVSSSDAVGVTQVRYQTTGALTYSGTQNFPAGTLTATANFSFNIPYGVPNPNVQIIAYAQDAAGNERASIPVNIILTDADITPPETEVISVANPGSNALTTVTYQVTSGLDDLDYVLLYFRRNGIGTFNRYTDTDGGNPEGKYFPQSGNTGTIVFNSTKMGGDGTYEFYTVGVDKAGNIEPAPKDGSGNVIADRVTSFNAGTVWTVINTPTVINEGDTTFDDKNLRIIGTAVTINGYHRFRNVELLNGAVLTHPETTMTSEYGINLELWTLTVDSSSSINVDGRGYLGGNREGNDCSGQTISNTNGSTYRSGGSYGGLGGAYDGTPNPVYGNFVMPFDLGSGGSCGGTSYAGGDGGGRIQIKAINVMADGKISANGLIGSGWQAGSGSGGSIYLIANTLSGNGLISSNGGAHEVGGGGGRIAIHYIDLSTKNANQIQALGGQGSSRLGGNGTVFLKNISESGGTLVVDGRSPSDPYTTLPIPPGYIFDNIVLRNSARVLVDAPLVVSGTLWVSGGSILTHSLGSEDGLLIQARRVEVDGTSAIDVSAKGYRGGLRDGNASCDGITLGGLAGAKSRSGGTYGGLGGVYDGAGTNLPYGHPAEPLYLGSGGSCGGASYPGGHGGGLVRIRATEGVVVNGSIRADGGTGAGWQAGSGSGGSIFIETSLLTGTGTISANGGANEVGGGGGRIAVFYDYLGDPADFGSLRQITAFGGHGSSRWGSAGTVLLRRSDQAYGDLYIDDNVASATSSIYTPLTPIGFGRVVALTEDTITTDGVVRMVPNGLRGLEVNPNLNQNQTYRVVSNTENTITVDVAGKPYLTSIAKVGDTYAGVYRFDNVYFRRGGYLVMGDPLVVTGTMRIDEYGKLTHYDTTLNFESMLDLTVGNLVITSTGSINVDGRGYVGGQGSGDACRGRTIGNALGSTYRSGGSYGGLGGSYQGGVPNPVYGSLTDPAG
ncbi:MAG: Ig-like domain-containing protein, partial [Candidatus Methanomethylicaceae archaeon]